jgi:hypothetical protein
MDVREGLMKYFKEGRDQCNGRIKDQEFHRKTREGCQKMTNLRCQRGTNIKEGHVTRLFILSVIGIEPSSHSQR